MMHRNLVYIDGFISPRMASSKSEASWRLIWSPSPDLVPWVVSLVIRFVGTDQVTTSCKQLDRLPGRAGAMVSWSPPGRAIRV